jgi:enamine deaminase RidA (YjgF/YER057c/UK114 family)
MTQRIVVKPDGVYPPATPYIHAIITSFRNLVFISGQVPVDANGQLVSAEDFEAQVDQVFANLNQILENVGASFRDVVKLGNFLTRFSDIPAFARKRTEFFSNFFPNGEFPTSTLVVVAGLANPSWLVEIEAYATIPE